MMSITEIEIKINEKSESGEQKFKKNCIQGSNLTFWVVFISKNLYHPA